METQEFQEIRLLSPQGRIGRLRYLAYGFGFQLILGVLVGVLAGAMPGLATIVVLPVYLITFVFWIIIAVKRSHDMNWSGWTVLLALIPLVGLVWLFKAGTEGANRFGNPPPPNSTLVKILGILLPILFLVGVVTAIAIPAYSDYVQRAQGLQ